MPTKAQNSMKYPTRLKARPIEFQLPATLDKYWHAQDDIRTYHFNALALFLPTLERLVVLTLKRVNKYVADPHLKSEITGLLAQEAIHGREFERLILEVIQKHYPVKHMSSLKSFRLFANFMNAISNRFYCGLCAAGEHFTAIAGALFLADPSWFKGMSPKIAAVMRWHSIEEIEHKAVVFDAFQYIKGSYFVRALSMIIMILLFFTMYIKPMWTMAKQDGKLKQIGFYWRAFKFYWGRGGWCRQLLWPLLEYFKFNFHPNQQKTDELISPWLSYFEDRSVAEMALALEGESPPFKRQV